MSQLQDDFPEFDAAWTLRQRELQPALQEEEHAPAKKKRDLEVGWQWVDNTIDVKVGWSPSTPAQLGTELLKGFKAAIYGEIFRRYYCYLHSSHVISLVAL